MTAPTRYSTARTLAAEAGRRVFFTGKPCRHGHVAERATLDGGCLDCKRVSARADRQRIRRLLDAATITPRGAK